MRVETERMYLYPLRDEEMRLVIEKESDPEMKQAYMEMLEGSLSNSDKRIWYAIWNMELKDESGIIVHIGLLNELSMGKWMIESEGWKLVKMDYCLHYRCLKAMNELCKLIQVVKIYLLHRLKSDRRFKDELENSRRYQSRLQDVSLEN